MRLSSGIGYTLMILAVASGCDGDKTGQQAAAPPPPEVTISQVVSRDVTDFGEFTGRTSATVSVDIRARVSGYLDEITFKDGQEVKKGDVLFQIDPRPFKAALENALGQKAQWEAKLARAKADVQRYEKLVPTGAATPQDLDKAKADMGEATAAIQSAEATIDTAKLNLEFARIVAPANGQISSSDISTGNLVLADNDKLTTIVSLDPMFVNFDVNERDLLRLRESSRASRPPGEALPDIGTLKVPVFVGLANEQGYPHQGVIDFADNQVDPTTGTISARGTFDNSKRIFKPGLFTRVRVPIGDPYKALLVAERAIAIDQGTKHVLTVDDKNTVQQRFIEPGPLQDDGLRVIKSGVQAGDWVVVNGLQRARPGKPVNPQRAEMPTRATRANTPAGSSSSTNAAQSKPATPTSH
ncbi:MAG: efflux RND transporter periplasmic adaptor subunit [Phycisphaerae bacterium]|nr:efflux RND transporter periplasmic adaptor subunit [Phycisphaerae bacterium]